MQNLAEKQTKRQTVLQKYRCGTRQKIHHSYPLNEKQQSRRAEPRDLTQTPNRDRTEAGTESSHSHTVTSEESPRLTVTAVDLSASLSPAPPHHCGPEGMELVVVSDRGPAACPDSSGT